MLDLNMKVDFYNDYTLNSGFEITDTNGAIYIFNVKEYNSNQTYGGATNPCSIPSYIASWKLSKIILWHKNQPFPKVPAIFHR